MHRCVLCVIIFSLSAYAQRSTNTYAAWGDSLTAGSGVPAGSDWPTQMAALTGWTVNNKGTSGLTSTQLQQQWNLGGAAGFEGMYTVIWIGVNDDYTEGNSVLLSNVAYVVSQLTTNPKQYLVVGILYSGGGVWNCPSGAPCVAKHSMTAALASAYPGHFVDMEPILMAHGDGSAGDNADIAIGITPRSLRQLACGGACIDDLHLNTTGYAIVAVAVRDAINNQFSSGTVMGGGMTTGGNLTR